MDTPRTPLEEKLTGIWQKVLGIDRIGIHANFLNWAAIRCRALRIVNQIRELLGEHVSLVVVFEAPDISSLAVLLEKNYHEAAGRINGATDVTTEVAENRCSIEIMREIVGHVPPAMPVNGVGKNPRAIFYSQPDEVRLHALPHHARGQSRIVLSA